MTAYELAYHHATPHGVVTAFHIPDSPEPVPAAVLERLLPEEQEYAREQRGYRQVQFCGGRLALREAIRQLGGRREALLPDLHGAPRLPEGLVGSISHKGGLVLALVARDDGRTVGVDLEAYLPERMSVAPKVLTPVERAEVQELAPDRRWIALLMRFSIKESIYKALHPWVHRYVDFHEARIFPDLHGDARVELDLRDGEGPFDVSARYEWLHGMLLTSARVRPSAPPAPTT